MNLKARPWMAVPLVQPLARQVSVNSVWLLLARLVTQAQLLIFTLLVARSLSIAGFGQYAFVAAVLVVGNVATTFGTDTLLIRDVARAPSSELASAALWLQLILSVIWLSVIFFGATLFFNQSAEIVQALELYSLSLIPLAFFTVFTSILRAHERMDLYLLLNGLVAACQLGGAWLVLQASARLVPLVLMLTGVQAIAAILAGVICRFELPAFALSLHVARQHIRHTIQLAWPFALLSLLAVLYQRLGVLMVSALSGNQQTGLFSAATRVIEPLKIVHLAVLGALLPTLSRLGAHSTNGRRLFKRTFFGLIALGAALGVGVFAFAQPLVSLLYGATYTTAGSILRVLALSLIPYSISASLAVRMVAQGHERRLMWIMVLTLVIVYVLNRGWVPMYGSSGAATTIIIGEGFQAGAMLWLMRRS
jgi:O-antigen/teichoic acid export membrane protein